MQLTYAVQSPLQGGGLDRNDIIKNANGSVDLFFGPKPPAGKPEKNWIKTLPNKTLFRQDVGASGHKVAEVTRLRS